MASLFIHHFKSWHQVFYIFGIMTIVWCFLFVRISIYLILLIRMYSPFLESLLNNFQLKWTNDNIFISIVKAFVSIEQIGNVSGGPFIEKDKRIHTNTRWFWIIHSMAIAFNKSYASFYYRRMYLPIVLKW